jgi:hypothetical protein
MFPLEREPRKNCQYLFRKLNTKVSKKLMQGRVSPSQRVIGITVNTKNIPLGEKTHENCRLWSISKIWHSVCPRNLYNGE